MYVYVYKCYFHDCCLLYIRWTHLIWLKGFVFFFWKLHKIYNLNLLLQHEDATGLLQETGETCWELPDNAF